MNMGGKGQLNIKRAPQEFQKKGGCQMWFLILKRGSAKSQARPKANRLGWKTKCPRQTKRPAPAKSQRNNEQTTQEKMGKGGTGLNIGIFQNRKRGEKKRSKKEDGAPSVVE